MQFDVIIRNPIPVVRWRAWRERVADLSKICRAGEGVGATFLVHGHALTVVWGGKGLAEFRNVGRQSRAKVG